MMGKYNMVQLNWTSLVDIIYGFLEVKLRGDWQREDSKNWRDRKDVLQGVQTLRTSVLSDVMCIEQMTYLLLLAQLLLQ